MMSRLLVLLTFCAATFVAPAIGETDSLLRLMDDAVARTPVAASSEADRARALAVKDQLARGPYEFEANFTGGRRSVDDPFAADKSYMEWSAEIARSVRWPEKRRLDKELGEIELSVAEADHAERMRAERLSFAALWTDWTLAQELHGVSARLSVLAEESARLEQAKVDRGAGRQVQADLFAAEAQRSKVQAEQDRMSADAARHVLQMRYSGLALPARPWLFDLPNEEVAQLLASPASEIAIAHAARLRSEQARLNARRAVADRRPDPTLGIGFSNEFDGEETALVGRFRVPFGGGARRASSAKAAAEAQLLEATAQQEGRDRRHEIERTRRAFAQADSLLLEAERAVRLADQARERLEKGYELGEVLIGDLLGARRTVIEAERMAAEQEVRRSGALLKLWVLANAAGSGASGTASKSLRSEQTH